MGEANQTLVEVDVIALVERPSDRTDRKLFVDGFSEQMGMLRGIADANGSAKQVCVGVREVPRCSRKRMWSVRGETR